MQTVETTTSIPNSINAVLKVKRKYWYVFETHYCVLCGRQEINKYRVYKEPKPNKKHIWKEDACYDHFI